MWKLMPVCLMSSLVSGCLVDEGTPRPTEAIAGVSHDRAEVLADIERHLAVEEIKQLKARYFRCMDTKDWTGLQSVFASDAQAVYDVNSTDGLGTIGEPVIGAAEIIAFIRRGVEPLITVHHGHMPEIELTSPTTARGILAMEDLLRAPDGSVDTVHGFGHYHETYERIDGQWRIKTLRLTRLRVDRS